MFNLLILKFYWCKGTANFSSVQEGTFLYHSYQKVGIVMLSVFAENNINLD